MICIQVSYWKGGQKWFADVNLLQPTRGMLEKDLVISSILMERYKVEALSDKDLKSQWEQIKVAYQMRLPQNLSDQQNNILFADFVNVSTEMDNRKLK